MDREKLFKYSMYMSIAMISLSIPRMIYTGIKISNSPVQKIIHEFHTGINEVISEVEIPTCRRLINQDYNSLESQNYLDKVCAKNPDYLKQADKLNNLEEGLNDFKLENKEILEGFDKMLSKDFKFAMYTMGIGGFFMFGGFAALYFPRKKE